MTDVVAEALAKYKKAKDCWADIYSRAREDLLFMSDEEGAQWDSKDFEARRKKGRPALQIDQLAQFVNQVANDIRMNTPSIDIIPNAGGADEETAEIYQGLIRNIEYDSGADDAYDYAVNMAIKCGIGFIRIDHDYKDDNSFEQELLIQRVVNPFSVLLDPDSIEPDGSDAKCAYVLEEMPLEDFQKRWPKAEPVSFGDESNKPVKEGYITICEYFEVEEEPVKIALLEDGTTAEFVEGMQAVRVRETMKRKVERYKLAGNDILEETSFPGRYIPIIPVYGEEAWRGGKRHLMSLIRRAKDPQRRYNYWASVEAEMLMKAPKSVIVAVGGTTENYADDYLDPDKATVLRYDQTDNRGQPAAAPQVLPPIQVPTGIVNSMMRAAEDVKTTMGLYNAFLGQRSNETSGVAIQQRKMEGDRAVYHFGDNLTKSITQVGRVCVSAIPEVYDTPRFVRVIGKEDDNSLVGINGAMAEGQERPFYLAEGQYSVKVTTGASYATMRQEAAEFFQQVIQSQPALMQVAGDLMFKYMDFPGAQALAERIKKTIPPQLLDENADDPQVVALQQQNQELQQALQVIQAEAQQMKQQLDNKMAELQLKAQDAQAGQQIDTAKLQLEQQQMQLDYELKLKELEIKLAELELKRKELELKEAQTALGAAEKMMPPMAGGESMTVDILT